MEIYLMGAEQPTNLRLSGSYPRVGMSFASLRKRLPKQKAWSVPERWPGKQVYLSLGGAAVQKMSDAELQEYVANVDSFLREHGPDFYLITGIDDPRANYYVHPDSIKFAPVWYPDRGIQALQKMAQDWETVALRASDVATSPALRSQLVPLRARHGVNWHLLDGARLEDLMTGTYQSAATIAWLSPMRYGETIVWDGTRMQRYPERMKGTARNRHRTLFTRAGFDADKILEDDHEEITRFTVWSFERLEEYVDKRKPPKPTNNPFRVVTDEDSGTVVNIDDEELEPGEPGTTPKDVDNTALEVRNAATPPQVRNEPRKTLPIFDFTTKQDVEYDAEGNRILVDRLLAKKGSAPLRQCDTCHIQATCPAFKPQAECAYALPIEIRTKEQLSSALAALLEKQLDRVAFMMMAEEVNGGYADPNTGLEVDRLMKMIETMKRVEDNREYLRFQVEAKGASGALSALFGEQAKSLTRLDQPIASKAIENRILDSDSY